MMSAYDRWVTSEPPDDGLERFSELVCDFFSDDWWRRNEDWFMGSDGDNILIDCFYGDIEEPEIAAAVIMAVRL